MPEAVGSISLPPLLRPPRGASSARFLGAMAAAATHPPPPTGFFTFLKHGALLPACNRGLFLPLLALTAALAAMLLLANSLVVQPLAAAVLLDTDAISRTHPASAAYPVLIRALRSDLRRLLLDRGNLWGPILSVAFWYVLQVACAGTIVALALLTVYLLEYSLLLLFLDALLMLLASLFLIYLTIVCAVAVVVSAAEPRRRGTGAVSLAWQLMQRKNAQAALYVVATCALDAAVLPVCG